MQTFLISRTDNIGDVILTLPLCGKLKETYPDSHIIFLGRAYTRPIIEHSSFVDYFLDWDAIASSKLEDAIELIQSCNISHAIHVFPNKKIASLLKKCKIPVRIGTSHRWYNWLYCNRRIDFTRKNSDKHESELNFELIKKSLNVHAPTLDAMYKYIGWDKKMILPKHLESLIDPSKKNIILHPKSKNHGREWPIQFYVKLIENLDSTKTQVYVCGVEQEWLAMADDMQVVEGKFINLCGKMDLKNYMAFIQNCDVLVASGTGPLHIAAAMGIHAVGIFPPLRPVHPGRWKPIGANVSALVVEKECTDCKNKNACACMNLITPEQVAHTIML